MYSFSLRRDFRLVAWGPTLYLNSLRAFVAGIVWGVVSLCTGHASAALGMPFMAVIAYFTLFLPAYFIVGKIVAALMPGDSVVNMVMGFLTLFATLGLIVADPLLFLLHKQKPALVPVEDFGFLNFRSCMFVLDPAKVAA